MGMCLGGRLRLLYASIGPILLLLLRAVSLAPASPNIKISSSSIPHQRFTVVINTPFHNDNFTGNRSWSIPVQIVWLPSPV